MPKRAIFFDTETTGINFESDYIIELSAYDAKNNLTFDELIKPPIPIPASATAIHNITDEMVAEKPSFKEVAKKFNEFCHGDCVLIAHNCVRFDQPFLKAEYERNGLEELSCYFLDSLLWARRYRPDLPKHSLQHLRETYGFPENNAHRALDDVITLQRIFEAMTDDLSMDVIYDLLNEERIITTMPFGKYKGKPLQLVPPDYVKWLAKNGALDKKENESLKKSFEKLLSMTFST